MIKVYTDKTKLKDKDKERFVDKNETFFEISVGELTDEEYNMISPIEECIPLGRNKIETPYGICTIYDISTGSKTLINVLRNPDLIFDVTGCGYNVLKILFREIDNKDIKVVLRHGYFLLEEGLTLRINDEKTTSSVGTFVQNLKF